MKVTPKPRISLKKWHKSHMVFLQPRHPSLTGSRRAGSEKLDRTLRHWQGRLGFLQGRGDLMSGEIERTVRNIALVQPDGKDELHSLCASACPGSLGESDSTSSEQTPYNETSLRKGARCTSCSQWRSQTVLLLRSKRTVQTTAQWLSPSYSVFWNCPYLTPWFSSLVQSASLRLSTPSFSL